MQTEPSFHGLTRSDATSQGRKITSENEWGDNGESGGMTFVAVENE